MRRGCAEELDRLVSGAVEIGGHPHGADPSVIDLEPLMAKDQPRGAVVRQVQGAVQTLPTGWRHRPEAVREERAGGLIGDQGLDATAVAGTAKTGDHDQTTPVAMEPHQKRIVAAALVILAFTIAWPALDNGFSLDDFNWLARVSFRSSTVGFLFTPEPGQLVNPGARTLWLAAFESCGLAPMPYHAILLLLHGVVVLLLWRVASETVNGETGLLAAALFCAQTAGAAAVFWFAAAPHVSVTALVLAGALGFVRFIKAGSPPAIVGGSIAVVSALLTKGTGLAILPVAGGWAACCRAAPHRRRAMVVLVAGFAPDRHVLLALGVDRVARA